ncbi:uncharacterized protein [Amphiura filiformis]|uniref:uncharacterized protein n=1 Tax=Amphiura filiformis TaxID=82378 RepID=UPI003B21D0D7
MANAGIVQQMSEAPPGGGFVGGDDGDGIKRRRSKRHKRDKGGGASQRRKLEKAQEHLRSRMRQRLTGPAMVSARLQKAGIGNGGNIQIHDDNKVHDLTPKVKTLKRSKAELEKMNGIEDSTKQLKGSYWRTQQDRYSNITHSRTTGKGVKHSQEEVPLHELVDRVLKRKEQKSNISPLTISAYKQPTGPFAIQQHSMIRKMVSGQPVGKLRKHPKNKGPYFVVLHHENPTKMESRQELGNIRGKGLDSSLESEVNIWRPELEKNARRKESAMDVDDRGVTNYKLQMQHAARLAEARFDYSNSSKKNRMQTINALPSIRSQVEKDSKSHQDESSNDDQVDLKNNRNSRTESSNEILQAMKSHKRARRQPKGDDFNTILRTRNRYTAKTKLFKEELTIARTRALSIIDEDQSSVSSDSKSRCLSGRRHSQTSLRNLSAQSLNRIEETKTPEPDDNDIQNAKTKQKVQTPDRSTGVIEEDDEEDSDGDESVFSEESSMRALRSSLESSSMSSSRSPGPSLQLSSNSNPLPPIQIRVASPPTNHDRVEDYSSSSHNTKSSTTQIFGQDSLPSIPIVPGIGKPSGNDTASSATNQSEMMEIETH